MLHASVDGNYLIGFNSAGEKVGITELVTVRLTLTTIEPDRRSYRIRLSEKTHASWVDEGSM